MNLTRTSWPLGWTPNADNVNGNPEGLLRMDNLYLDELGCLTLVRGLTLLYQFSDYVDKLHSRVVNGIEHIWTGIGPTGSSICRDGSEICNGNDTVAFGDCLGQTLIFSGATRKKDNLGSVKDLGLFTPKAPGVSDVTQPSYTFGDFSNTLGNPAITGSGYTADTTTLQCIFTGSGGDFFNIGDGAAVDPSNDIIQFDFECSNGSSISSIRLDCQTEDNGYYTYTWDNSVVQPGPSTGRISARRGDFKQFGRSARAAWNNITATQITVQCTDTNVSVQPSHGQVVGGKGGQLNGTYQWLQVDIFDNGTYVAKSPASPLTAPKTVQNGFVTLTPDTTNANATGHQFFRGNTQLGGYYFVGEVGSGEPLEDTMPDSEALEIDIQANLSLLTCQLNDPNPIPDSIYGVEGMFAERMLYMSSTFVYLSDTLNPDAVDSRYTLKAFGDPTEQNLWLCKVTNNVCILGTNKDLYEITGTWTALPDGTIDVTINKIGEKYPPITRDFAPISGGGVAYFSGDGVRVTSGSNSQLISQGINLLVQGESRHGIQSIAISGNSIYRLAAGRTRLYASLPTNAGGYYLYVYNVLDQTWRLQYTDPVAVYSTQTDRVLLGYAGNSLSSPSGSLYQLDTGAGVVGNEGFPMTLLTVFDSNGQPRNRKDTFTLKIVADTGGSSCNVSLAKDGGGLTLIGTISGTGPTTFIFPLNSVTLGFRYQLQITDTNLITYFKLYEYTIEYDARPEQLDYLRIPNTNLGSYARKRVTAFAFVIDTLGNNIAFTPWIDNSPLAQVFTVNTTGKQTFICYFTSEVICTDIGGIFSGGVFEFYSINEEESISEKMPVPCEFLVIPANNYGTPNRKRHSSYKFQINTRGEVVTFTPIIDGVSYAPITFNTTTKQTVEYYFTQDTIGIDIGGTLSSGTPFEFYGVITPQQIEELPPLLEFYKLPNTDLGNNSRKRIFSFAFVIDTHGINTIFTPYIDDIQNGTPLVFTTNGKETVTYYFTTETIGIWVGGTFQSSQPFECYGIELSQSTSEVMPSPAEFLVITPNNYGTPNRKRHSSYKFQINTRGNNVTFTPILDGISYTPAIYNTSIKTTVEYFFTSDTIAIDIGGTLSSSTGPFEFYGTIEPQQIEQLPPRLEFYKIPNTNLGTECRKRFVNFAFVIDTYGQNVTFTPLVDNTNNNCQPNSAIFNTAGKQTVILYFLQETIGTDIGGYISGSQPFEFYGLNLDEIISEKMPVPCEYLVIPPNNYGTPHRKRHSSYKFQINTRGGIVGFTPIIDGIQYPTQQFITSLKQTIEYFFTQDTIGIDIGGILASVPQPHPNGLISTPFEFYGTITPEVIEELPARLEFYKIPNSNLGNDSRKRVVAIALVIDTYGNPITFTPWLDNVPSSNTGTITTSGKQTFIYYFTQETICTDIGGTISGGIFEFYGISLDQCISEKMPQPTEFLVITPDNYGTPNRKRHSSYKFEINTRGHDTVFTPILDRVAQSPKTFNTSTKTTVEYFFQSDTIAIDIGGTLYSPSGPFEFYGVIRPQEIEQLPARLEYYKIPNTNLGTDCRKRFVNFAFVVDTYGQNVTFTPLVDNSNAGVQPSSQVFNTNGKQTVILYFTKEIIGTDIGGTLLGNNPFEFYGLNIDEIMSEKMPVPVEYLVIPANNYGTPNRKRHTSYKFQINTRGQNVSFTPILDGTSYPSSIYNTAVKQTVEYYFPVGQDIIGIDIAGIIQSLTSTPFEFYGTITPQKIEELPPRLETFRIPNDNFGSAARKRVRTLPIIIDTYGNPVVFTPIVDGINDPNTTTLISSGKTTLYHFFITDSFGIDYGGLLAGNNPFEFYELAQPQEVEVLPVPKRYDQIGPLRFDKIGKLFAIRVRMIVIGTTTQMPFAIYGDPSIIDPTYNDILFSGTFPVVPGVDEVYEIQLPKSVNFTVLRITFGPINDSFHRYDIQIKVHTSGMETDAQWNPAK